MDFFRYVYIGLASVLKICFNIIKYAVKGICAPAILISNSKQENIDEKNKKEIKADLEKEEAYIRKEELKHDIKIRKEVLKQEELERKKEQEEEKKKELEIKREQEKAKKEETKKKKEEEKAKKALLKKQKEEEKKQRKLELAEKKRIKQTETKEEKKQRKIREKEERKEKARIKKQNKINSIHEKQKKAEDELYRSKKQKEEAKKQKEEKKKAIKEEKARIKAEKHKKQKDSYVNENVKIEKPGFFSNLKKSLHDLNNKPKKMNSFAKARANRRDLNRQALLIDFEGDDAKRSDIKLIYEYEAKDPEGKYRKGHFEAFSKVEVHSFLLSEGYEVYKIHTNKWIQLKYASSAANKKKFKNKDLIFFLTQLSTYLKAGITLSEALKILSRQFTDKHHKSKYENIFKSINYELSIGESFSETLDKQGNAFPKLLINMLKTAEMTGSLPEVLDDMADYYTEMEESRRQLVTAMMYPSIVAVFAVAVMTFIMVYVVPQFVAIYDSMDGTEIPAFTKAVMAVSAFLKKYLILVLLVAILVVFIFYYAYKKIKPFRKLVQIFLMKLPAIGDSIIDREVTTFTKTLGSLLSHNVPIIECMDILNKITNNEIYKEMILDVLVNLAKGGKISDSFQDQWAFPVPAYEMIVTGERTGELAEMMQKVSLYYQDLQKNSTARIKTFVEPAITIFLAIGTGIIVLAIVIPMFNMYNAVSTMS